MTREEAIQKLRHALNQVSPESPDSLFRIAAQIRDAKEGVIARYAPMFSSASLDEMTAEDFKGFLLFRNNQHWDSVHRQGGWMTQDMPKLREAIRFLADEDVPVGTRLNRLRPSNGDPMVKGLGPAVITAVLQICYPGKYGVLNNTAKSAMKQLGLWPETPRGATFGERYEAVNRVLLDVAPELGVDLWTLDMLWWRVANSHVPKGSGPHGGVGLSTDSDETTSALDEPEKSGGIAFGLERHLQDFLVDNWDGTDLGQDWQLFEEDGDVVGAYYNTGEVGEIDILARHRQEAAWLIIELKKDQTSDSTVGQILRYMAWVRRKLAADGDAVRGLIICHDVDQKLQYALDGQPNIQCRTYEVSFTLKPAPELP